MDIRETAVGAPLQTSGDSRASGAVEAKAARMLDEELREDDGLEVLAD
jgi:hypothetical protein